MRASDHPAAKPRQYRPPVFRADDEPDQALDRQSVDEAVMENEAAVFDAGIEGGLDRFERALESPQPTREPIATAPQDGTYLRAYWGPDDEEGRLIRWREGRHFNNRRWVTGGTWAPADSMIPLPAEAPTEWLKPPEEPEPESEDEPAEAEEEAA